MTGDGRVIVVGGGVAGLVAARELVLAGREVVVLERSATLGGQIAAHSVAGIQLDAGADAYPATGKAAFGSLVSALKLESEVVHPDSVGRRLYRRDGSVVALPDTTLLGIPGVPLAREVIGAIGMGSALRAQLDGLMPGQVASRSSTLDTLVRGRMGQVVLDQLVTPVARADYGLDPAELDVATVAPGLIELMLNRSSLAAAVHVRLGNDRKAPRLASLRGGLFRVIERLGEELERFGVTVHTGVEAVGAEPHKVTTADGTTLRGQVVLATELTGAAARVRERWVTLAYDAPELADAPGGMEVLVAADAPDVEAHVMTQLTARWAWLAEETPLQLVRLGYREGVEATPERAHRDAERLFGRSLPQPSDAAVVDWERAGARTKASHAIDGMQRVGEAGGGTDLDAVITAARAVHAKSPSGDVGGAG